MTAPTIDLDVNRERRLRRAARAKGFTLSRRAGTYTLTEEAAGRFVLSVGAKAGGLDAIEDRIIKGTRALPPNFIADDGTEVEFLHVEPCWVFVTKTHPNNIISVYRSVRISEESETYKPVLRHLACHELIAQETIEDTGMIGYRAEHLIYV